MPKPTYLYRRGERWYFRIRSKSGRLIRRSLGDITLAEARAKAQILALKMKEKPKFGLIDIFDPETGRRVVIDHGDPEQERKTLRDVFGSRSKPSSTQPAASLKTAIAEYVQEKVAAGSWTSATKMEQQANFELFLEIVAGSDLSWEVARDYLATLQKLPTNMRSRKDTSGLAVKEIAKKGLQPRLSVSAINKRVAMISSFMGWAEKRGWVEKNYFSGFKLKDTRKASSKRLPFDERDLREIGKNLPSLKQAGAKRAWQHWLPILGYYTGCRIEELCQLEKADVRQTNGIWYLDINAANGKNLKNQASERKVPMHPDLFARGFLEWVDGRHDGPLFPHLTRNVKGVLSSAPSKWFGRWKNGVLSQPDKKTFHSFRHTVVELLKEEGVEDKLIGALLGHADSSITTGVYGSGERPLKQLKQAIDKLPSMPQSKSSNT